MPRFYFHVKAGVLTIADCGGSNFASLEAAIREAEQGIRFLGDELEASGVDLGDCRLEVYDDDDRTRQVIAFKDVLALDPSGSSAQHVGRRPH